MGDHPTVISPLKNLRNTRNRYAHLRKQYRGSSTQNPTLSWRIQYERKWRKLSLWKGSVDDTSQGSLLSSWGGRGCGSCVIHSTACCTQPPSHRNTSITVHAWQTHLPPDTTMQARETHETLRAHNMVHNNMMCPVHSQHGA